MKKNSKMTRPRKGGTLRAKKERLARIDAAGSPPRGLPPPWGSPAIALARSLGRSETTACLRKQIGPKIGRRWRIDYTKTRNCACCKKRKAATAS